MDQAMFRLRWICTVLIGLLTIHSSDATVQRPLGRVNEPLPGSGEIIPGTGEMSPAEREVVPGEGEIIPGSQLEGENLHNPNPQAGEHPGEATVIDSPVANVNHVENPNNGNNGAPQYMGVTHDQPHIDEEVTLGTHPLKLTTPRSLFLPTQSSNLSASEVRNSSGITTGDATNSSLARSNITSEEILSRATFPETTSQVNENLQTSMSSSASIHIVPTRVILAESTTVVTNNSDVQIPQPDSNLRLTSRPVIEETETVSDTVSHTDSSVREATHVLESSEPVLVESRIVPEFTVLETLSLVTNNFTTSSHQDREGSVSQVLTDGTISVISSTFVYQETDMTLSSKDRKEQDKPQKSSTDLSAEQTEAPSSVVVLSRSVLSEQTLSIQDITPSSSMGTAESTSSSFVTSSSILPTSSVVVTQSVVPEASPFTVEPVVMTLPSGSHEIVIQKNSTLSVIGTTTTPSPQSSGTTSASSSSPTSTMTTTASNGSMVSSSTSQAATTRQSTTPHPSTLLVSLFSISSSSPRARSRTSTMAPYTGDVTLHGQRTTQRMMITTKRRNKPHRSTTPSNDTVTESPATTNNSDNVNRKKTAGPNLGNTTEQTLSESTVSTPGTASTSISSTPRTSTHSTISTSRSPTSEHVTTHRSMSLPPSTMPPVFAQVKLQMSWPDFCSRIRLFRTDLQDIFHVEGGHNVSTEQIMIVHVHMAECVDIMDPDSPNDIEINFYLVDVSGNYNEYLTIDCARVVTQGFNRKVESYFNRKLLEVKLNTERSTVMATRTPIETKPVEKGRESLFVMEPGITIAIVIASVGGLCCIALIILQIVMRRRNKRLYLPDPRHHSFTSMDSIAMASVTKSRPNSGLFNPGLDQADLVAISVVDNTGETRRLSNSGKISEPLFPVNFAGLANRCLEPEVLKEEFQIVPNYTPKLSTVPVGAEDKNRYANVIPIPQTRVKLKRRLSQVNSDYINANYITGYGDDKQAYIATQGPLDRTVADFWRMVWEQQSRVIIMLTAIQENGHPKCSHYWPDCLGDSMQRYGDFMIHLKKKDVHQEYIISVLELKDIENNLVREVKHCWYTCWPVNGLPEPISLVKFILDTRVFYEDSGAPLIVHCSPGTGRTGTLIATDICMRQFESRRIVDVLNTVYRMRQERAGSVQTKEQYILIYNALNEYASVLRSPAISTASSSVTLHNIP